MWQIHMHAVTNASWFQRKHTAAMTAAAQRSAAIWQTVLVDNYENLFKLQLGQQQNTDFPT